MRSTVLLALSIAALVTMPPLSAQQAAPSGGSLTVEEVADRVFKAESGVTARMRGFRPIIEVYAQTVEAHERLGTVPVKDDYFLGQFEWSDR